MIEQLRRDGLSPADATWRVLGLDPALSYRDFRGAPRPPDAHLLGKLSALLSRVHAEAVEGARQSAMVALATSAKDAADVVADVTRGRFKSFRRARVQLDAAVKNLEAVGVGNSKPVTSVQIGVAIGLADKLRRMDAETQ